MGISPTDPRVYRIICGVEIKRVRAEGYSSKQFDAGQGDETEVATLIEVAIG